MTIRIFCARIAYKMKISYNNQNRCIQAKESVISKTKNGSSWPHKSYQPQNLRNIAMEKAQLKKF